MVGAEIVGGGNGEERVYNKMTVRCSVIQSSGFSDNWEKTG